jgi:hypothetical protein
MMLFLLGVLVGTFIGIFIVCLCVAGRSDCDEYSKHL